MKILVVEDEKKIANLIKRGLEDDTDYQIMLSYDGDDGLKQARSGKFDLVILDCRLPKKDGLVLLHELREAGNQVPVLMLTAKAETVDVVSGLDTGADDYLTKPFVFAELHSRVRALLRRGEKDLGAEIRFADLRIDPVDHRAWRNQEEIQLSATEYRILAYFVRHAGTVLSRVNIADNCWDDPLERFSNIVDVYINYLRKKIDGKSAVKLFHTVRGQGYILKE